MTPSSSPHSNRRTQRFPRHGVDHDGPGRTLPEADNRNRGCLTRIQLPGFKVTPCTGREHSSTDKQPSVASATGGELCGNNSDSQLFRHLNPIIEHRLRHKGIITSPLECSNGLSQQNSLEWTLLQRLLGWTVL